MFIYIVYILFKHSSLIYIPRTVVFTSPIPHSHGLQFKSDILGVNVLRDAEQNNLGT